MPITPETRVMLEMMLTTSEFAAKLKASLPAIRKALVNPNGSQEHNLRSWEAALKALCYFAETPDPDRVANIKAKLAQP
jgi:hypothetical protein